MRLLRSLFLNRPILAVALGLAALALRLSVPAGFMPALHDGVILLAPCPGPAAALADHGASHHDGGSAPMQGSCAFADLSLPAIGGAAPLELATAILFLVFTGLFLRAALPEGGALRLRPPLRDPPPTR